MSQMLFFIWTIDVLIFVCLWQIKCDRNMYFRKIILFICSQLYNLILGYYTYIMFIFLMASNLAIFNNETWILLSLIIESLVLFALFLLPINLISKKESEINLVVYVIVTIETLAIGILTSYFGWII